MQLKYIYTHILSIQSIRLLNTGIRFATLGTRFLFVFFLAKYLDPASVGYYGVFTATVGYAIYFVGLDFYTYTSREILKSSETIRGQMIKSHAALSGLLYLTFLPLGVCLIAQSNWPNHLVFWFLPLLLLEHFNQEVLRLLGTLSEQLTASLLLFIRQGSWAIAVVLLMVFEKNTRTLDWVMAFWSFAGVASATVGIIIIRRFKMTGWQLPINWAWVKTGISVSIGFLIATLALRGIQTFDRYWVEALGGIKMVGAYVLMLGVASTMQTFLDASVFSFAFPTLIRHHQNKDNRLARKLVLYLYFQTSLFALLFGLASWLLLPYLLRWIGNPIYQEAITWYPWILFATTLNTLSSVSHLALYARGVDKPIIYSHFAALIVFIIVSWALADIYSVLAVFLALNFAFFTMFLIKTYSYFKVIHNENLFDSHA